MNLVSHLTSLYSKKDILEGEITQEMNRPLPDFIKITELKKKKMALKSEISVLESLQKITGS